MPARRAALFLSLAAGLAGCAVTVDAEQAGLCRRLIPALFGEDAAITVTGSEAGRPGEVFIRFRRDGEGRDHFVFCRFAGSGLSLRKREIETVGVDGTTLGPSATYLLKERWLKAPESVASEPRAEAAAPVHALRLGQGLAYGVQQALSSLPKMGIYALLAASFALIYGLVGRINLAFGAFAALGGITAVIAITLLEGLGVASLPYGLPIGCGIAVATGALYGAVAARRLVVPMLARSGQQMLVASVGLLLMLEEFLRIAQGANTRWLASVFNMPVTVARGPAFDVTITPISAGVAVSAFGMALMVAIWLRHSAFGRDWRAAAQEPVAAAIFGIDLADLTAATFAFSAALAAFAGVLVVVLYGGMGFAGGTGLGLTALVAAILGGIGTVGGAMTGGLIIGAIEALWSSLMPIEHRDFIIFALLAILMVFRPAGLFGGREPGPMRV